MLWPQTKRKEKKFRLAVKCQPGREQAAAQAYKKGDTAIAWQADAYFVSAEGQQSGQRSVKSITSGNGVSAPKCPGKSNQNSLPKRVKKKTKAKKKN